MAATQLTVNQERVIAEIRRVAADLGVERLSQREFDRHHKIAGLSTAGYQFGSWNTAVRAAGLAPHKAGGWDHTSKFTDEELLRDLLRLEVALCKSPTERMVAAKGSFSPKPYKDRWGSIRKAVAEAHRRYGSGAAPSHKD